MEDVKWLLKKYGSLIALMIIIVITGSIVLGKRSSERNAEEVWEPPIEILSDNISAPSDDEKEISDNTVAKEGEEESKTKLEMESSLWFLPQTEKCLITETENSYGSNIKGFTREQCRKVVSLLGEAGYVSITEDTNMENYGKVKDFMWGLAARRTVYQRLRIH